MYDSFTTEELAEKNKYNMYIENRLIYIIPILHNKISPEILDESLIFGKNKQKNGRDCR